MQVGCLLPHAAESEGKNCRDGAQLQVGMHTQNLFVYYVYCASVRATSRSTLPVCVCVHTIRLLRWSVVTVQTTCRFVFFFLKLSFAFFLMRDFLDIHRF